MWLRAVFIHLGSEGNIKAENFIFDVWSPIKIDKTNSGSVEYELIIRICYMWDK